jgi:hypothetical protein
MPAQLRQPFVRFPVRHLVITLVSMLLVLEIHAAEVDQFTIPPGQPAQLPDSAPVLEAEVNRLLAQAVEQANDRFLVHHAKQDPRWLQPRCDEPRLYTALTRALARSVVGQLETFAEESPHITRRRVTLAESIYRDFFWQASPSLVLSERMAAVIKVGGVEMGTDKLGHFFTEGYSYFEATEHLSETVESGLLFGEWSESVYFGAQTTGVFSFADLAANFHGLRFWNRILAKQPDPLGAAAVSPYIQCRQARWQLVQTFRWDDYVDNGWSEAVNCPVLGSEELLQRIRAHGITCRTDQLPKAKYGQWQPRLLNLYGHRVLPDYLQPEIILERRMVQDDVDVSPATLDYIGDLRVRLAEWRRVSAAALQRVVPH